MKAVGGELNDGRPVKEKHGRQRKIQVKEFVADELKKGHTWNIKCATNKRS